MNYLTIDPSSTVLGYSVLTSERQLLASGTVDTKPVNYEDRYDYIIGNLKGLRQWHQFVGIACERPTPIKGQKVPALEQCVASIKAWAHREKLPIVLYSPGTWKKSVTGNGFATKEEVAQAVYLIFPGLDLNAGNHVTDAIGIGLHHVAMMKIMSMAGR